ncbi:MAG: beta-ketoacyl-ACP synthase II [Anaerolineales bacterium]|jgi:beta-ketoacyl-acyl-carrier-protein synthase II|nr:beta-ketoacyl-ACP synthase II [Anaerolineales bacterium]
MQERIVITGMGTVNPIGHSAEESWRNALAGVSGVAPITLFDPSRLLVQIACEVKNFDAEQFLDPKDARRRDRFAQFAAVAVKEALGQSRLNGTDGAGERVGVVIATAIGGLHTVHEMERTIRDAGPRRMNPFSISMVMANGAAALTTIDYGFQGPSFSLASACATGTDAIGIAWTLIRAGVIDAAVAGASEATVTEVGVAAFDRVGAMSRRNDAYDTTPAPFDRDRDGLVMGEGAAVLILERESHARGRGAPILAELAGYGASSDAFHITAPAEDGSGGALAIRRALASAEIEPGDVDYINAHGTGTRLNDVSETRAIKAALGEAAYRIPASSTKSMTGHMMGASGALEALFCVQAVRDDCIPPTIHYQNADPECDLDYVPNQMRALKVNVALSNSFGFGGHNAVLVVRKYA